MRTTASKFSLAAALASSVALTGCFGPTYGTGVTQSDALMNDMGSALALGRKPKEPINYAPRPEIVQPSTTATLPAPQESIVNTAGVWPESPEQRRARIRAQIDEGNRDPNFITNPDRVAAIGASEGPARGSSSGQRVYLTDPPVEYRVPAQTAEAGDLGRSEAAKARELKAAQGNQGGFWRNLVPWL
ncbi:MAG: hypothetical protein AAFP99_08965 [Pseudomonadota bacterium]